MARTRAILKRMRSVRNIRTVTKAMQTVAAARFKVAHDRIQAFSPYGRQLMEAVAELVLRSESQRLRHRLLEAPEGLKRDAVLVITSSRGLCGSYNMAVLDLAIQRLAQLREGGYEVLLHVVGTRGLRYLQFRGLAVDRVHEDWPDVPQYSRVAALADEMMAQFLAGEIGGLEVAYMQFVSTGQQRPAIAPVLPVCDLPRPREEVEPELLMPYDFVPDPEAILRKLLPATVRQKLHQCLLDAAAAEQFMRRAAMQGATDNADDMLREMRIIAHRLRQRQITSELSDIMGGRAGPAEV